MLWLAQCQCHRRVKSDYCYPDGSSGCPVSSAQLRSPRVRYGKGATLPHLSSQFPAGLLLGGRCRTVPVPSLFHLREEGLLRGEAGGEQPCTAQPSLGLHLAAGSVWAQQVLGSPSLSVTCSRKALNGGMRFWRVPLSTPPRYVLQTV